MLPLTSEVALVKSAVGHLQTVLREEPDKLAMGLTSLAWLRLPGDEAAAIERACDFSSGRCAHGFISRCEERECRAVVDATYRAWAAEAEIDRMEAAELERDDEEPSEADLARYYHHEGGEDPVTRQQIRDAGRPGL